MCWVDGLPAGEDVESRTVDGGGQTPGKRTGKRRKKETMTEMTDRVRSFMTVRFLVSLFF